MYKKVIDILTADEVEYKKIAIQIAKTNPSIFVKAANKVSGDSSPEVVKDFLNKHGSNFAQRLNIGNDVFFEFLLRYGKKRWCKDVALHLFGKFDAPRKIEAIKLVREYEGLGLRDAKHVVDAIMDHFNI